MLLNDQLRTTTAEFKTPPLNNGSTAVVTTVGTTSVDAHVGAINVLITKLKAVTTKFKEITAEIEEAIGQHIKAIKIAEANNWEDVVKARCGLSRSRAYELMAIADGTKSVEQVRYETNVRKIRHRQIKPSVPGTDGKELAAEVNAKIVSLEAGHKRQIARFEAEIARLSDASALSFERDALLAALNQVDELLIEIRGLNRHFTENRISIVSKINRAHEVAARVLKSATFKSTNSPVKQVA